MDHLKERKEGIMAKRFVHRVPAVKEKTLVVVPRKRKENQLKHKKGYKQ